MDGSKVTVVVLGQKEVGKTTFIAHSLDIFRSEVEYETSSTVNICGRDISVTMIRNPERLTSAHVAIVLLDLTVADGLSHLPASLEMAKKLSPTAVSAVVATKADLYRNRKIATEDAVRFCEAWPQGSIPLPYYETGLDPPDSIMFAFQEILAKPLIDDYVLKITTEPELLSFITEAMDWCLDNGSASLLTHLRSLGHSIPSSLFFKYSDVLSDYLFSERPLVPIPDFKKNDLSVPLETGSFEDSLDEPEEPLQVIDNRPPISITPTFFLTWSNLSLTVFLPSFLQSPSLSGATLSHIDISHNKLVEIPIEIFHLPALKSLDVSHNCITLLPMVDNWRRGCRLQCLYVSYNSLTGGGSPLPHRKNDVDVSVPCAAEVWNVDLSHNDFCGFPSWVLKFPSLKILKLSGNPQIRVLPSQLSQMSHLTSLSVDPHSLQDPPPFIAKRGPVEILRYLHLKKQAGQVWNSLRVVVVGPQSSGKSILIAKIKEDKAVPSGPTKGLEVSEWRHRGAEFFSFKPKLITVDFWDFSGDPNYHIIYTCFKCSTSLHLVVCDAQCFERVTLLRWLAGIQATLVERIPVIIVFTHIDKFTTREQRDSFRKDVVEWLHSWEGVIRKGRSRTASSIPQGVKNLYGDDMTSSFESLQGKISGGVLDDREVPPAEDLPLLPAIHRVFFVNAVTGDGVGSLRKCLLKITSGSLSQEIASFSGFQMIGREIPTVYIQVEQIVRHLRLKFRSSRREGEQRPFYTISELMHKKLRRPLTEYGIMERDFVSALNFLHEYGFVYMHKCKELSTILVSVDPQLVGYLMQRMIRAGLVTQEVSSTSCHLPNSHIFMLWGVEPVWSRELEQGTDAIHSQHLLDFLHGLNLCSPLLPGLTLLPSILPDRLPFPHHPSPSPSLQCRRVYFFGFFPVHFFSQIISRVVMGFLKISGGPPSPISPGDAPSTTTSIPFEMQSGYELYVWKKNLFMRHEDGAQLLVKLLEGVDMGPNAVPHEARIDVLLDALPTVEAKWLRVVTTEIDHLLEHTYPGLLSCEFPGQLVETYVPFPFDVGEETEEMRQRGEDGMIIGEREEVRDEGVSKEAEVEDVDLVMNEERTDGEVGGRVTEEVEDDVFADEDSSPLHIKSDQLNSHPLRQIERGRDRDGEISIGSLGCVATDDIRNRKMFGAIPIVGSLPSYNSSPGSSRQRLLVEQTSDMSSWEILSKQSSTSTRFSIKTDYSSSHFLVPVWECLRAAFKSPAIRLNSRKLYLNDLIPDLLFGDIPSELILRIQDSDYTNQQQNGVQNRIKTKWNGMVTSEKQPMKLQSLSEMNGIETDRQSQNRKRAQTVGEIVQNGIEFEQIGLQTGMNTSGLHIRSYYTCNEVEDCGKQEEGATKMLSLKRCLQKARDDLNKLRQLQCPYVVSAVGLHFSPPSIAVESSPLGSLHDHLRGRGLMEMGSTNIHYVLLQLSSALEYFHSQGLNYHTLRTENVLLWSMDPITIKLSDSGITHTPRDCELCAYIKTIPSKHKRKLLATRIDYMLLGLLIYEIATGTKPYQHTYPLSTVILALIHRRLTINIEAELKIAAQKHKNSPQHPVSCHRLCMQTTLEQCITNDRLNPSVLKARLSLCAGNKEWSPMRLALNPEAILCSEEGDLIYWVSGSRGLVTGTVDIATGSLNSNVLQEAPRPESGLFSNRRGKPVPIAVGRATGLTLVEETQTLWVGAENGSRGLVYIFKLPDMRTHHNIHLQDAVLSLIALNNIAVRYGGELMKYRVLVGLANGTIIQFLGVHQEKIIENPLQGPKLVIHLFGHKPCIAMQLTAQGHVWCSSGSDVEVLDTVSLKSIRKLTLKYQRQDVTEEGGGRAIKQKNDIVTLLCVNRYGVWTVGRRSSILRLWNQESGDLTALYNVRNVITENEDDITAMALHGRGVWLGTRSGYILLLDAGAVQERREACHLGLQHCGEGRVKNIVPLVNTKKLSAKMEVFCSLEYPDEVSGAMMVWQFQCQQEWRPRPANDPTRSQSAPLPSISPTSSS